MKSYYPTRITWSILFICSLALSVFGQGSQDSSKTSLTRGSWSLQFQIEKDFTLGTFQGSNISAKKHFSRNKAIRFGISLSGNINDSNRELVVENDYKNDENTDANDKTISLYFSSYYLYYLPSKNKINLFLGGGPIFGVTLSDRDVNQNSTQDTLFQTIKDNTDSDSWSVGFHLLIGTEWFITKHISLLAEYGSTLSYSKRKYDSVRTAFSFNNEDSTWKNSRTENSYSFTASEIKFGLSIYF